MQNRKHTQLWTRSLDILTRPRQAKLEMDDVVESPAPCCCTGFEHHSFHFRGTQPTHAAQESATGKCMAAVAEAAAADANDLNNTLIGENINVLRDAWQASKDAGNAWQIWTIPTVVAPGPIPSILDCGSIFKGGIADDINAECLSRLKSPAGGFARTAHAMDSHQLPWNSDDHGGCAVERCSDMEAALRNIPTIRSCCLVIFMNHGPTNSAREEHWAQASLLASTWSPHP